MSNLIALANAIIHGWVEEKEKPYPRAAIRYYGTCSDESIYSEYEQEVIKQQKEAGR